jgi:hypothetical protein
MIKTIFQIGLRNAQGLTRLDLGRRLSWASDRDHRRKFSEAAVWHPAVLHKTSAVVLLTYKEGYDQIRQASGEARGAARIEIRDKTFRQRTWLSEASIHMRY